MRGDSPSLNCWWSLPSSPSWRRCCCRRCRRPSGGQSWGNARATFTRFPWLVTSMRTTTTIISQFARSGVKTPHPRSTTSAMRITPIMFMAPGRGPAALMGRPTSTLTKVFKVVSLIASVICMRLMGWPMAWLFIVRLIRSLHC